MLSIEDIIQYFPPGFKFDVVLVITGQVQYKVKY